MQPVLTASQSADQDSAADAPIDVLLDRAGLAIALVAADLGIAYGDRAAVLVGPGNNGADGYIAAIYLRRRGVDVGVHALAEPKSDGCVSAAERAIAAGVRIRPWDGARQVDLVVDALFGGGFRGELPDLESWQGLAAPVLAVDVPSGLSATSGAADRVFASALATVTFHGPKVGHLIGRGPELCGEIVVADIGLPEIEPEFWLCGEQDAPIPQRSRDAHKWSAGSVLVVGGSTGLDGAATLTGKAALRSGAGAVMIACPPDVEERIKAPEIMTRAVGEGGSLGGSDLSALVEIAQRFDVVVVGPGLGMKTGDLVQGLLSELACPMIVDADGLNALDGPERLMNRSGSTVITPHAGEFARLTGQSANYKTARALADNNLTVLLKGGPTFVMGSERWAVTTGGPELATIGTGDVLAGMIGAFVAAGLSSEVAVRSAAFWHGIAGSELASHRLLTADALLDQIPATLTPSW